MNNSHIHLCPICAEQNKIDEEFCKKCAWELIDIPKNASSYLLNYFNTKIEKHKNIFIQRSEDIKSIKQLNNEHFNSLEKLDLLSKQIIEISQSNTDLKQSLKKKKDLEEQLNSFIKRYGDNWVSNKSSVNKEIAIVNWELAGNSLIFTSKIKDFKQEMSKQIVVLFKQTGNPTFGSFDIAILSDCNFNNNNNNSISKIDINMIPKGSYFIKPINLISKSKNIQLFHKDQSLSPNNFDWNKTKINVL